MANLKRNLLIAAGTIFTVLGVLGMFLPVLPTTPFLLLAAACYARSSDRFYYWLLTNRWFGEYIRNYLTGRGIPLRQKAFTILMLWLTIGSTILFINMQWWVKAILFVIAAGVTIHIAMIKTIRS
jgi:hypothetical protein